MRAAWIILALVALAGCELAGLGPRDPTGSISPIARRVDAIAGRTLVVPVELAGAVDLRSPPPVRLDDGRIIPASLVWIGVSDPGAGRWTSYRWLPPPGRWTATPSAAGLIPPSIGAWFIAADLPVDAVGQGLWIGRSRLAMHWISPAAIRGGPWDNPVDAPPEARGLLHRLCEPDARSPARRWRARLVAGELADSAREGSRPTTFDDPVLEAMASQNEARWAAGLSRLAQLDGPLALEVARALAGTVRFESGVVAPVWTTNDAQLASLQESLLDPRPGGPALAERVRVWLDAGPKHLAWVVDDAGLASGDGVAARLGVANLRSESVLAAAQSAPGTQGAMELLPVEPRRVRFFDVEVPLRGGASLADADVRVGAESERLTVMAAALPCDPPGLSVAPFFRDWSLDSWLVGGPVAEADPAWATAALVQLEREPDRWTLLIECRWVPDSDDAREVVRVWIGPRENPTSILRVSSDGIAIDERSPAPPGEPWASVVRKPDRWMARIRLPEAAATPRMRLGIERIDARASRSAWPRPMLPWQAEPGRAIVDLAAWMEP